MKVLLLNQFFHPDLSATSKIATELATDLADAGIEVTVLASRGSYLGGRALPARGEHRGVRIVRVAATSFGKRTLLHRAVDYASFYLTSAAKLATLPRHDVVLALTTPPLIAAAALVGRALKGSRLVYWVQDLYPEVAVAFGALRERSLSARLMAGVSRAVMKRADLVIALGEQMRRRCIGAGARPDHAVVVPNWADASELRPVDASVNRCRDELARGARILVMYSGNMGRAHDMDTLLEAARLLAHRGDIAFVFIGDGAKRPAVEMAAAALPNVRLAPYQPLEALAESLSAGDVHLLSLVPEVEGLLEPSKLYGVMAVARPALFVGPSGSEVARTIRAEGCGAVVKNGDAPLLAAHIEELSDNQAKRSALGHRARIALESRYSRARATSRLIELLSSLDAAHPT